MIRCPTCKPLPASLRHLLNVRQTHVTLRQNSLKLNPLTALHGMLAMIRVVLTYRQVDTTYVRAYVRTPEGG